jgi:hypothetical protein
MEKGYCCDEGHHIRDCVDPLVDKIETNPSKKNLLKAERITKLFTSVVEVLPLFHIWYLLLETLYRQHS